LEALTVTRSLSQKSLLGRVHQFVSSSLRSWPLVIQSVVLWKAFVQMYACMVRVHMFSFFFEKRTITRVRQDEANPRAPHPSRGKIGS
jgi:hypothetical protein